MNKSVLKLKNIKFDSYQRAAAKLNKELARYAPQTFWVGGAVRDIVLNRKNFDVDIATSLIPSQTKRILKKLGVRFFNAGEKFGTIGAILKEGVVEITTFRSEADYKDFRHPRKVVFGNSPQADVQRRDFTINALYFDPEGKEVFDFVGGLSDIKSCKIKFVGNANKRITEDPLRMIRAVRFAASLDFGIDKKDFALIRKHADLILKVSGNRIKDELDKIMSDKYYLKGIKLLDASGLLAKIFPEIQILKSVKQSKNFHAEGNVFIHTLKVLENLSAENALIRYAGLFHDLGKFGTGKKVMREGREHMSFHGHARKSAEIFKSITKRIPFSKREQNILAYLLEHHMDLRPIEQIKEDTLIRWAMHPNFVDQINLRIADSLGAIQTDHAGKPVNKNLSKLLLLRKNVLKWKKALIKKFISGDDVKNILKIGSGAEIGKILEKISVLQAKGMIKSRKQGITRLKSLDKGF